MKLKIKKRFSTLLYPITGLAALFWFLFRVIPRPSRAAYPCQKVAAPAASGFLIWLAGLFTSHLFYHKMKNRLQSGRSFPAIVCVAGAFFLLILVLLLHPAFQIKAEKTDAFVPADLPNDPVGTPLGLFPGRVVWIHDPSSTSWDGATGTWWEDQHTDQTVVSGMLSRSIRWLTEEPTDSLSWDALFKHFNQNHGKGPAGYQAGEKIAVKINLNNCDSHGTCGNASYTPPQLVLALVRQLVDTVGVPDSLITCYDVLRLVPGTIYDRCRAEYPHVRFVDWQGGGGREHYIRDTGCVIDWSEDLTLEIGGGHTACFPVCVKEADYIINLASLKGHNLTGVTFCAKNGFGSFDADRDGAPYQYGPKAAGVHPYVAVHDFSWGPEWEFEQRDMGTYNPLVDLMGHEHFGGKTVLFLVEGLYGAAHQSVKQASGYTRWMSAPFNDDWPSSLFVSQDNVAIESVCLDFMRNEPSMTQVYGNVDNYLHEASRADDPPSGTFYDPEGDGTRLSSLGVHEHWNNAADKQYSRNLGTGEGIELIHSDPMQNVTVKIRVFLEGPFNTSKDTMITSLKTSGNLTLSSPFSEDTVTVDSIPGNITDWILVQLRTSPQGPEIASKSAFLRNDGWIISSNGVTPFLTLNVNDGEYYISIKHRNHLSVISKNPVPLE